MTGHRSQRTARDEFTQRVRQVADLIESPGGDILLVSHAGMMVYLRAELLRRGFQGLKFHMADHGRLYVFEVSLLPLGVRALHRCGLGGTAGPKWFRLQSELHGARRPLIRLKPKPLCWRGCTAQGCVL